MIKKYKLIKHATADGLVSIEDHVQLGKVYHGDPATIREATGYNIVHGRRWKREVIDIDGHWFPTELLEEVF